MRNLVFILLLFTACQGSRHTLSRHGEENLRLSSERLKASAINVPGGGATLRIPLSGLRPLPEGAAYTERDGRAALSARILRDTLYIDATCDSLQQVVWEYERLLSERQDTRTVSERHTERKSLASRLPAASRPIGAYMRPLGQEVTRKPTVWVSDGVTFAGVNQLSTNL